MSRKNREITNALLEQVIQDAMVRLGNPHSAQNFISDVLTQQERLTIGRRILIARLFVEGYSGAEIADVMPVSPNTLSRIRRWLETDTYPTLRYLHHARQHISRGQNVRPKLTTEHLLVLNGSENSILCTSY